MPVNKIEYRRDSSVEGFAAAGDVVQIKSQNVETIKEDINEGNTRRPNMAQMRFIAKAEEGAVDDTEYDGDVEEGDLEGEEGEEGKSKEAPSASANTSNLDFGKGILAANIAMLPFMWAGSAPVIGMMDLELATLAIAGVAQFDSEYNARLGEAHASGEYVSSIDENIEILNEDLEAMSEFIENADTEVEGEEPAPAEGEGEGEGGGGEDTSANDPVSVLARLKEALAKCQEEGDEEGAAEIEAQIAEIESSLTPAEGETEEEDPVEQFLANNQTAHDIDDVSNDAAEFLHEGFALGQKGIENTVALAGSAVTSYGLAGLAAFGAFPFLIPEAVAGATMCVASSAMYAASSMMMTVKAAKEFHCGNKSKEISRSLEEMQDPLAQHDEIAAKFQEKEDEQADAADDAGAAADAGAEVASTVESGGSPAGGSSGGGDSGGGAA